jgi:ribosomal protein L11 methyltransferase
VYRASIVVPHEEEEIATARMLDVEPRGCVTEYGDDGVELSVYVDDAGLAHLHDRVPEAIVEPVADGWQDRWKQFHVPVVVGPIWIGPPWETPPTDCIAVVIDPGRAFGTGAHETTRLALELLVDLPCGSLLDIGCGSGVLAIAAAKLGFAPVSAVDVEQASVDATRANARANGVAVEVRRADALVDTLPPVDVAVANILLAAVEGVAPRLDCARLVASGYLRDERPSFAGFEHAERREGERWAADLWLRR